MIAWIAAVAFAGKLYVNDVEIGTVDAGALAGQTFEGVTLAFDSDGNLRIAAPRYQIEVVDPPTGRAAPPAPAPRASPVVTAPDPEPPSSGGIPAGRWWLVTEDNGSIGHTVGVYLNGTMVKQVNSGDAQLIEDVSTWLNPGSNVVHIVSTSPGSGGGTLYVYLGTGNNDSGTLVMDAPTVQYGVGPTKTGTHERDYSITASP